MATATFGGTSVLDKTAVKKFDPVTGVTTYMDDSTYNTPSNGRGGWIGHDGANGMAIMGAAAGGPASSAMAVNQDTASNVNYNTTHEAMVPQPATAPAGSGLATFGGGVGIAPAAAPTAPTAAPAAPAGIVNGGLNNFGTPASLGAPTAWNVTGNQTVSGLLAKYTDPNSALNQQAAADSLQASNARGLVNSSLAVTGAQDAVLRTAMPAATADAATYAKAGGYNADQANVANQLQYTQGNSVGMAAANNATALAQSNIAANTSRYGTDVGATTSKYTTDTNAQTTLGTANIAATTQRYTTDTNAQSAVTVAKLNIDAQASLNAERDKNQALLQTSSAAASAYNTFANSLLNIQMSTTMDGPAKATAIVNAQNAYNFAITAAYKLSSANLPDFSQQLNFDPNAKGPGVTAGTVPVAAAPGIVNGALAPGDTQDRGA